MLPKLLIFLVLHIALSMIYFYYTILLIIVQDLFQYFSHFIFKHLISCDNSLGGSMNYKDQMKRIRDYNGLSQKNVAEILHIARSTYNQFEQQYDIIPLKHLNNFCNHFKISVDYVFNLTLEKKYVDEIEEMTKYKDERMNEAKKIAAFEITKLVHGEEEARKAEEATKAVFEGKGNVEAMDSTKVDGNVSIVEAIVTTGIASSKGQAKTLISQGAISLNDNKIDDIGYVLQDSDFTEGYAILKKGKKVYHKLVK